jgi:hypothetical protein
MYDLILWVLNKTNGFPKSKRFSLGTRLENVSLDLVTAWYRYRYAKQKERIAGSMSRPFNELKLLLHVAHDARLPRRLVQPCV